jgi:hypothetical protein
MEGYMAETGFRAGVGRVTITPPLTAPHASWGAQVHVLADGIDEDLWATVLVVDDGQERAAFVDLDLIILSNAESDAVRAGVGEALGISPDQVRVSVTHSHAGPPPSAWNWTDQGGAAMAGYYALVPELTAGAARIALQDLQLAKVAAGSGESRVAVNRREISPGGRPVTGVNPQGTIDPEVLVVRLDRADGSPLAAIVGYTMHPTTMGPTNRIMSPDWPGHMKRTVERITGATCLFAQGATGNVGPGPEGFTDDLDVIRRLGGQIGCEAARVFLGLRTSPVSFRHERVWESGAPLGKWTADPLPAEDPIVRATTTTVDLPLIPQPPVAEAEARVQEAQATLDRLKTAQAPASEVEAATFVTKRANMALSRARMYGGKASKALQLHLLRIGPAVFAGTEGEPFCEIGLAIKAQSPFPHTWFGGYTSGWAGYIPIAEEYLKQGYEVDTSPFAPEAAQKLVEGTVAALKSFAGG